MNYIHCFVTAALFLPINHEAASAAINVAVERNNNENTRPGMRFEKIPAPSKHDAAARASIKLLSGEPDGNGGSLTRLNDGRVPAQEDEPEENFFFTAGSAGGRILVDLGSTLELKQINTYSWHPGDRGPQLYSVYGAEKAASFNPASGTNESAWKLIARVDTRRTQGDAGGQYGVSISDSAGVIGTFRYLLFDVSRTENNDAFGNTFFSEIDVVDTSNTNTADIAGTADAPPPAYIVRSSCGTCEIAINTANAPALKSWAETKLAPVLAEWYPKLAKTLSSEGFTPPTKFSVLIEPGRGVAATSGTRITANSDWLQRELTGEALGALLHEEVHVLQQYRNRRGGTRPPGWLVEGIPDYVRWFKYEPQSHGADLVWLRRQRNPNLNHEAGYRTSANFLNYVIEKHDPAETLITKLNAACRMGKYTDEIWKESTGKSLTYLSQEWKDATQAQLSKDRS